MIKEISNTDTGVVFLDNLWGWERYFGALSFYYACNCCYFITFLKTLPAIVTPRLSNHYTATTLLVYWKSMSPLFISLSFLIIAILFRSLRTVPRQYISLSKSFSNNIRTTVSSSPSLFFFNFFPYQSYIDILFCCSIDTTTWNPILLIVFNVLLTRHSIIEFSHLFINWLPFRVRHRILKCFI